MSCSFLLTHGLHVTLRRRSDDFHSRDTNLAMPNPFNKNRMRDVHWEQAVRKIKQNCKV